MACGAVGKAETMWSAVSVRPATVGSAWVIGTEPASGRNVLNFLAWFGNFGIFSFNISAAGLFFDSFGNSELSERSGMFFGWENKDLGTYFMAVTIFPATVSFPAQFR